MSSSFDDDQYYERSKNVSTKDYYGILGLPRDCATEDVKRKYKVLAQKLHPDKIGSDDVNKKESAQRSFALLHEAYETLQDEEKRKIYDVYGREGVTSGSSAERNELVNVSKRKTKEEMRREFEYEQRRLAREKAEMKYQQSSGYEFKFSLAHAFDERLRATRRLGRGGKSVREQLMKILGEGGTGVVEGKEGEEKQRAALRVIERALGDFHVEDLGLDFLQGSVSTSMSASATESVDVYCQAQAMANADGRGAGVLLVGVRKQLGLWTSADWHMQMPSQRNGGMEMTLEQKLTNRTTGTMTCRYDFVGSSSSGREEDEHIGGGLGLSVGLKRQLTHHAVGNIDWTVGPVPGITTGCRGKAGENGAWKLDLSAGVQNFGLTGSYQRKVVDRSSENARRHYPNSALAEHSQTNKIKKYSFKFGTMGIEIENGTNATLSDGETSIGWGVCVGVEGCVLKIKYRQRNQQFEFPILLAPGLPYLTRRTAILCLTIPNAVIGVLRNVFILPLLRRKRRFEKKQMRLRYASEIEENRKDALAQRDLVAKSAEEKRLFEREIGGLDIEKAVYGSFENIECDVTKRTMTFPDEEKERREKDENKKKAKNSPQQQNQQHQQQQQHSDILRDDDSWIDVTVALRHMVERSQLELHDGVSYSSLLGFCDVDPLEKKHLKIRYRYRRALHETCVPQDVGIHLPYDGHRIADSHQTEEEEEEEESD